MIKTVKIAFCGQWSNQYYQDYFTQILSDRVKLEISDTPDFVVCGCYNNDFLQYGDHPIRIYNYTENVVPDFNLFDYAIGFNDIHFDDRHLHIPYYWDYNFKKLRGGGNSQLNTHLTQRKFCNFIYSNTNNGYGTKVRIAFAEKLMAYKHIDCPGKSLNNMQNAIESHDGDWVRSKREFIKNYKFTIAFENTMADGYTTEKLIDPLLCHSIPIYWGNKQVTRTFNPKAFINANDFPDFDALVQRVIELDNNDDQYMEMLRQKPVIDEAFFEFDKDKLIADFMINIFENGRKYTDQGLRNSPYYHAIRVLQTKTVRYQLAKFAARFIPSKRLRKKFRSACVRDVKIY